MGAPGTTHYLRAGDTPDADRVHLLAQLDPADTVDPHAWTINGEPLTAAQLDMAHNATLADAETAAEMLRLTGEQSAPEGIIGDVGGYPIRLIHDEPPAV